MAEVRVQRRLAAILAADVVGYSRLMHEDETRTRTRYGALFEEAIEPSIADHGGRIVKTMGDGFLAEFSSIVDAVECAVDIQRAMPGRNAGEPDDRAIRLRIGVNLGDVIVEGDDIHGDGVNVAARLEAIAEPNGICVSGTVFDSVKDKLSLGFEDLGPRRVKNIADPIRIYRILLDPAQAGRIISADAGRPRWLVPVAAALLAVLAATGGLAVWQPWAPGGRPAPAKQASRPLPDKPSIAVLPFANMSGEQAQEYFSDGMTEDLITDLSKVSGLLVIARNSVFTFKNKSVPITEVARTLGVRYVLEGSVRKADGRVRINAQLIDASTGFHLWADRFDRDLENVFALQDEVVGKIVSVLKVTLSGQERQALTHRQTKNTKAYDLYLRGLQFMNRFNTQDIEAARAFFQQAIELDPNFALAYAMLSRTYAREIAPGGLASKAALDKAYDFANKAVALDPSLPQAFFSLAFVQRLRNEVAEAIASAEKAIKLSPNYADGYSLLGNILTYAGKPERSVALVQEALQLSPHAPAIHLMVLGQSYFALERYEDAIRVLKRGIQYNPGATPLHYWLAASYAQAGRTDDARWEIGEAQNLNPAITLRSLRESLPFQRDSDRERFLGALRKAGMPED